MLNENNDNPGGTEWYYDSTLLLLIDEKATIRCDGLNSCKETFNIRFYENAGVNDALCGVGELLCSHSQATVSYI